MLTLNRPLSGAFVSPGDPRPSPPRSLQLAKLLPEPLRVMEVCGGHTPPS